MSPTTSGISPEGEARPSETHQIITRKEATAQSLARYYTGKPCTNGHVEERRVSHGVCLACDRERALKAYHASPEKSHAQSRNWRAANPEKKREQARRWAAENPAAILAQVRHREASKLQRTPPWANQEALKLVYQVAHLAKVCWPEHEIHVDHIEPLRGKDVSGFHVHNNLRIVLAKENLSKGNRRVTQPLTERQQ